MDEAFSSRNLVLDTRIRDWVLIPIVVVMFLVAIVRHYITKLINTDKKPDIATIKSRSTLTRARRFRANGSHIPLDGFRMRKAFFNAAETGQLSQKLPSSATPMNPLMDPSSLGDMMKKNMAMIIPQFLIMGWVNYFFSGFVIGRLPFGLTLRFKSMVQSGISLTSLDVTYVSSLSWYIITLFGLRGLISIVLGDDNEADDVRLVSSQLGGGTEAEGAEAATGMKPDYAQLFSAEREALELTSHDFSLINSVETRILNTTFQFHESETEIKVAQSHSSSLPKSKPQKRR